MSKFILGEDRHTDKIKSPTSYSGNTTVGSTINVMIEVLNLLSTVLKFYWEFEEKHIAFLSTGEQTPHSKTYLINISVFEFRKIC